MFIGMGLTPKGRSATGKVLIARGRDAADVAITTTFGPNTLESFRVWTDTSTCARKMPNCTVLQWKPVKDRA